MTIRALLLGVLLLALSGGVLAQDLPHARTLFTDTVSVPPFPYKAETDSVAAQHARAKHQPVPQVEPSAVLDDGREVPITEYASRLRSELSTEAVCFIGLSIEWNGTISSARVHTCRRGSIPDSVLIPAVRRIRATVVDYGVGGFPVEWAIPIPPPHRP